MEDRSLPLNGIDDSRMIVVAIDNDGLGRMNEYAAWKFQES